MVAVLVQQSGSCGIGDDGSPAVQSASTWQARSMPDWVCASTIGGQSLAAVVHVTDCTLKPDAMVMQHGLPPQFAGPLHCAWKPPSPHDEAQAGVMPVTQHCWPFMQMLPPHMKALARSAGIDRSATLPLPPPVPPEPPPPPVEELPQPAATTAKSKANVRIMVAFVTWRGGRGHVTLLLVATSNARMRNDVSLADEEVVARVRGGDTAVFEILMRRYNQRLFRAARAITRDDADAEDAVQQAYLAAYKHLDQFAGTARFSTWLTRIAVREALGKLRTRKRRGEVDLEGHEETMAMSDQPDDSPEKHAERRELVGVLESAVDALPEIYRVVFMMREVEQLSTTETAEVLELSEEAVKVRLHRARAMLRDGLMDKVDSSLSGTFPFMGERCDRIVANVMAQLPPRRLPA